MDGIDRAIDDAERLFVAAGKLYEENIVRARDWLLSRRGSKLKGESQ